MKYLNTMITFSEFPDEITLCINITGCPFHCSGCHSPELWEDVGTKLTIAELDKLIKNNSGVTCIGFMGGSPNYINALAARVKRDGYLVGWYWGGDTIPYDKIKLENFDYIKIGPYIEEKGPLDNPNTNQKMFEVVEMVDDYDNKFYELKDITFKFWKHGK